jgi:hypothetical protein
MPSLCSTLFRFYDVLTIQDLIPYLRYGTWTPLPVGIGDRNNRDRSSITIRVLVILRQCRLLVVCLTARVRQRIAQLQIN